MLANNQDQPIALSQLDMKMFDEVDSIIASAVTAGDPLVALEYGKDLVGSALMRGLALAKLLYRLRENWEIFKAAGTDDSLEDMAYAHIGRSPETVTKYIRMWESVFENDDIPENVKKQLMGRSMPELLLITALAREGTTPETLEEIAHAPDRDAIRDIIKRERGGATSSKNSVYITIEMREGATKPKGTLTAVFGKERTIFGTLDVDSADEFVQKAINRILNSAHIKELL